LRHPAHRAGEQVTLLADDPPVIRALTCPTMTSLRTRGVSTALLSVSAWVTLCLPTPAAASPAESTTPDLQDVGTIVDELVPDQLAAGDIPGAVVTVVADGQTVFSSGYGVADPATGAPMDP